MPVGRPRGLPKTGGRRRGTPNKATADVKAVAGQYSHDAVAELARLAREARSDKTRVAAIRELLNRAYGRAKRSGRERPVQPSLAVEFGSRERTRDT